MPRTGRPPKADQDKFTERIELRMLPAEKISYEQAAAQDGESLSAWIRSTLNKAAKVKRQKKPSRRQSP